MTYPTGRSADLTSTALARSRSRDVRAVHCGADLNPDAKHRDNSREAWARNTWRGGSRAVSFVSDVTCRDCQEATA